jgi:ubiquinone/menaquinone biosynthesis C-methylase UbiE
MYQMDYLVLNSLIKTLEKAIGKYSRGTSLTVLDIGCGSKPYFPLFKDKIKKYVGIDLIHSKYVDCIASAEYLPVGPETFDIIISTQMLEHVENPPKVIEEMYRVLKKEGIVYLSTPGVWEKHGTPNDYWRWTDDGLKIIFDDFSTVEVMENGGAILCLFQLLNLYIKKLPKIFKPAKIALFLINNLIGKYFDNQKYNWFVINYLVIAKK